MVRVGHPVRRVVRLLSTPYEYVVSGKDPDFKDTWYPVPGSAVTMTSVKQYAMLLTTAASTVLFKLGEHVGHDLVAYGVIHVGVQGVGFVGSRVVLPMVSAVFAAVSAFCAME